MNQAMFIDDETPRHPPIPPNCNYFVTSQTGTYFTMISEHLWMDRPLYSHAKGIIAAVARCAWLDEAYREEMRNGPMLERHHAQMSARNYAEAWRIWGQSQ